MDKNTLKEIILEQYEDLGKKNTGIGREILEKIQKYLKLTHIIVITGIRRVGKSTLLLQIMQKHYQGKSYYFNFEDERLLNFTSNDFNSLFELFVEIFGQKKIFFFDEIQNVRGWENFVRRMQEKGYKFFITGSNASLLSRELGSKLTGRYIAFELYPFSFKEYLNFKKYKLNKNVFFYTKERAKIKNHYNKYLKAGGLPEYLKYQEREILVKTYEDILYRDIVTRYDIKETKALRELGLYYFSNIANLVSFNKLKEILKLGSVNTIKNYTDYLENSFMVFTVNILAYSLAKQFIAPKKVYCLDNGLAESISFSFSKNQGKFLENMVFIELKRRGKEIFYYKTKNSLEVDFVCRKGNKVESIIQVCDNLANRETEEREIKSLNLAMDELKLKKSLLLTSEEEKIIKNNGKTIEIIPVYKWLLK